MRGKVNRAKLIYLAGIGLIAVLISMGCGVAKDTKIQLAVKEALGNDRNVQADKLTVNVKEGVVTISGELYTPEEIDLEVQIAGGVEGVVKVVNNMTLPDTFGSTNPIMQDYGLI